jgi:hypothetical protein
MADIDFPVLNGVVKKLLDLGDGHHAEVVAIGGLEGDVVISGDANVDTSDLEALVGPLNAAAEEDPAAASATLLALLRGILAQLVDANATLTTIAANTAPE